MALALPSSTATPNLLTEDHRPREPVTLKADRKKSAGDVVLIIDESIAGAYLDIQ